MTVSESPANASPLRIVHLRVRDFMGINAIEIDPPPGAVKIAGKNEQGKTSLLNAILYAFAGKRFAPEMPIKRGEKRSSITAELSNGYTITRRDTENDSYLEVVGPQGKVAGPQEFLRSLGADGLGFDPLEFANADAKRQRSMLMRLLGIEQEVFDARRDALMQQRKTTKAMLKRDEDARDALRQTQPKSDGLPETYLDIAALKAKADQCKVGRDKAASLTTTIAVAKSKIETATAVIESSAAQRERVTKAAAEKIAALEQQIRDVEKQREQDIDRLNAGIDEARESHAKLTKTIAEAEADLATVSNAAAELVATEHAIEQAQQTNERIKAAKAWRAALDTATADMRRREGEVEELTAAIESLDSELSDAMSSAKCPVPGLSFSETGETLFEGVPFSQASSSRRLTTSVLIMMHLQPADALHFMITRDGSLLDPEHLEALCSLADLHGWQLFIELTNDGGEVAGGFTIHAGEVKKFST